MAVELGDVKKYLGSQPQSTPVNDEVLTNALEAAEERVTSRCMDVYVQAPVPDTEPPWARPDVIDQAVTMLAARLYRRRFSVGGFEGFGDLGLARVPALDPDIEDLLTRYVRYDFA